MCEVLPGLCTARIMCYQFLLSKVYFPIFKAKALQISYYLSNFHIEVLKSIWKTAVSEGL